MQDIYENDKDLEAYEKMCTRWVDEPDGSKRQTAECSKMDQGTCSAVARPYTMFRRGGCPLCSIPADKVQKDEKKVNALKASKRSMRGE
jgi:hypothetical protein